MRKILLVFIFFFFFVGISAYSVPSNASVEAKKLLVLADSCINMMADRNIPFERVNETYLEASQLYDSQFALEKKKKSPDYSTIIKLAKKICEIRDVAVESKDELDIFISTFEDARNKTNLSSMLVSKDTGPGSYFEIIQSFKDERFEETLKLINEGYKTLSEIEASQTAAKLFYSVTKRNIKTFFIENWKRILIILSIILVGLFIFWKSIQKLIIRIKLRNLLLKKMSLFGLIKQLQNDYFEKKTISESEFSIKLGKFKDMIRDVNREIPLLREQMMRIEKNSLSVNLKEKKKKRIEKKNKSRTKK